MSVIQPHFGVLKRVYNEKKGLIVFTSHTPDEDIRTYADEKDHSMNPDIRCFACQGNIFEIGASAANGGLGDHSAGPFPGLFACQNHKLVLERMRKALSENMKLMENVSDQDVNLLVFNYMRYLAGGKTRPGQKDKISQLGSFLKGAATYAVFKELVKNNIENGGGTWTDNPGAGEGGDGEGGASSLSGGSSALSGDSAFFLGADPFSIMNTDLFRQMKNKFTSSSDSELESVLRNYIDRLSMSRRSIPAGVWNYSLTRAVDLHSFEENLMHDQDLYEQAHMPSASAHRGLGMGKGLFRASRGLGGLGHGKGLFLSPDWNAHGAQGSPSSSAASEESFESEGSIPPFLQAHHPPPSPSSSRSSDFGAPAEALASLRL